MYKSEGNNTMNNKEKSMLSSLSYYHPIRYALSRNDFINEVIKSLPTSFHSEGDLIFNFSMDKYQESYSRFIQERASHSKLSMAQELYPTAIRRLYTTVNRMYLEGKYKEREAWLECLSTADGDDYAVFKQYALLNCYSNNIFDFDSDLLKMFESTDVDNVLLKDINLPFPTTYLHFGKQSNKKISGNISAIIDSFTITKKFPGFKKDVDFFLDGAYISQCPNTGKLRITLTTAKDKKNKYIYNCIDSYEDTFELELVKTSQHTTVGEAVELQKKQLLLFNQNELLQKSLKSGFRESLDNDLNKIKLEADKKINYVIKSLKIIVNCILYLQSYSNEIEEDYPSENVEYKSNSTNGFVKTAVAKKESSKRQFQKIKFCGRKKKPFISVEQQTTSSDVDIDLLDENKRSLSPHKRRAHTRKQRYGKGLEQWRYVWIKETTIHKDKYQYSPNNYRIYEVETPTQVINEAQYQLSD
ncbi:hypothetical protein RIVM261_077710 [Rivularia sp. IAM M-261]|nr:hypothetical protein RIVM261_077710 [Rivularia sp. IAM M-261]